MWTRSVLTACVLLAAPAARADFSIVCDEQSQVEDILRTTQEKGFGEATMKYRAYYRLRDERNEPTCEVSHVPHPASLGEVVARFPAVEFLPAEVHDVVIVEIHKGERTLFGTINRFVGEKPKETGL